MTSYATTQGGVFRADQQSSNHNVWNSTCTLGFNYDFGGSGVIQGYSTWQSAGGFDPNSTTANPNLSGTYTLGSGSSAIGLGTNMTSSCSGSFAPLCTDKAGTPRPSSGGWDAGAYQFSSAGGAPAPPTGLAAIIQ
jgi:hypothetical protein